MSMWTMIADALGLGQAPAVQNSTPLPSIVRGNEMWDDLVASSGGLVVPNERTALQISAVYACVNLIAGAISAMPMNIYRQAPDGERNRLPNDGLWWVLNEQMTPRWSAASGWEFLVLSLLLYGDAFAKILRNRNGEVTGLMPVHPWRVSVAVTPDALRLVYAIEKDPAVLGGNLEREVLDQDDVLHVAGFGFDGLRGMSPLRHSLRMAGSVALATQEYSARFFANSARPDYVLQTAGKVAPETIEQIKAQIDQRHGSPINAHRPMVLTGGMEAKVLSLPLEDLQLLQIRQFQIEEIARIYGVPPFMIGHTEKTTSWGSGVEGMGKGFVRYTLRGHLNKFQNELNRKFFRTAARVAEFDTTELERGDTKGLFEAFRIAVGRAGEPGFMTVQEVRERLNLKRTPDGDLNPGGTNAEQPAPPAGQ
jgi:HK97 family phage portal protein